MRNVNYIKKIIKLLKSQIIVPQSNIKNLNDNNNDINNDKNQNNASISVNKSYCEALLTDNKKQSILCVKPTNTKNALQDIKTSISPDLNVKFNFIKQTKNGNVIINCDDEESKIKLVNTFNSLADKFRIIENTKNLPTIKIVGIEEDIPDNDYGKMENIIKTKNFEKIEGFFKINNIYTNIKNHNKTIYATCSGAIYKHLMSLGRIYLHWGSYKIYEDYCLGRCQKCCAYGHSKKRCLNTYICSFCAGDHSSVGCRYKTYKKCINCINHNIVNKSNININHYAHDNINCSIFNKLKRNKINLTNYE